MKYSIPAHQIRGKVGGPNIELAIEVGLGFLSLVLGIILFIILRYFMMAAIIGFIRGAIKEIRGSPIDPSISDKPLVQERLYLDAFCCGTSFAIAHVIMLFKYDLFPLFPFVFYLTFWFFFRNPWFFNSENLIYNLYWGKDKWIQIKLKTINLLSYIIIMYILIFFILI